MRASKLLHLFITTASLILLSVVSFVIPFKGNIAYATAPNPSWWVDNNGYFSQYDDYQYKNGRTHQGTFYSGSGVDSYLLSTNASYDGVTAVGPRPAFDGVSDVAAYFTTDANASQELEWECTELVKRSLYLEYGVASLGSTYGYQVVDNYSTTYPTQFYKIANNGTAKLYPKPGDVLSYGTTSPGHTALVQSITNQSNGNATVQLVEQNSSASGITNQDFNNWQFQNGIDNDPNNTSTVSGWLTPLKWINKSPSGTTSDYIYSVAASSPTSIWAAGSEKPSGQSLQPVTYYNNGSGWTKYMPPGNGIYNEQHLTGIASSTSGDTWTVGWYYNGSRVVTLAYHWNSSTNTWSKVTSDNPSSTSYNYLTGVAIDNSGNIYATGYYSSYQPLIEKWNGTKFAQQTISLPSGYTSVQLNSIAFSSATNGWAVGFASNSSGFSHVIYHYDGSSWTPTVGSITHGDLLSVTIVSDSEAWAVGHQGTSNNVPLILHYTNGSWSEDTSFNGHYPTGTNLQAVGTDGTDDVWVVGYINSTTNHFFTMHYNGSSWAQVTAPSISSSNWYDWNLSSVAVNSGVAFAGGYWSATSTSNYNPLIFQSL